MNIVHVQDPYCPQYNWMSSYFTLSIPLAFPFGHFFKCIFKLCLGELIYYFSVAGAIHTISIWYKSLQITYVNVCNNFHSPLRIFQHNFFVGQYPSFFITLIGCFILLSHRFKSVSFDTSWRSLLVFLCKTNGVQY